MESEGQSVEEIFALLVHSSKVGANDTEGIRTGFGAKAAGDFLFDLGHAYCLFGKIMPTPG